MAPRIAIAGVLLLLVVLSDSGVVSFFLFPPVAPGCQRRTTRSCFCQLSSSSSVSDSDDGELQEESSSSFSGVAVALDPASDQAAALCCDRLGLTDDQFAAALELTAAVCEWNDKVNLVSRRDCRPATVLARHVLPSLAAACGGITGAAVNTASSDNDDDDNPPQDELQLSSLLSAPGTRVADVGTGGGFPGLPLSIRYPATHFVLVDSVGKKIAAVRDVAAQLRLPNVQTYHGRAEDYDLAATATTATSSANANSERFDVVTGRSVTALPQFCAWVQHLLKPETGHLIYWIGGDIDPALLERTVINRSIQDIIPDWTDNHDKRILVFPAAAVRAIAAESGIVVKPATTTAATINRRHPPKDSTAAAAAAAAGKRQQARPNSKKKRQTAKGAWRKKSADEPRQRGYDNFKRYSSLSRSSSGTDDKETR